MFRSETRRQGPTGYTVPAETSDQADLGVGDSCVRGDFRMWLKLLLGRLKAAPDGRFRESVPAVFALGRTWDGAESRASRGDWQNASRRPSAPRGSAWARARVPLAGACARAFPLTLGRNVCRTDETRVSSVPARTVPANGWDG